VWTGDLESQIERARIEMERLRAESERLEAMVGERTLWAERLNEEIAEYRRELHRIGSSGGFAGRKLGLVPSCVMTTA